MTNKTITLARVRAADSLYLTMWPNDTLHECETGNPKWNACLNAIDAGYTKEVSAALADPVPPVGGEPDQIITLQQKINLLRYHLSDYEFEWEKAQVQRLAGWYCPECGRNKEVGHSDKCELAQALKPLKTDEDFQQFREYIAEAVSHDQ